MKPIDFFFFFSFNLPSIFGWGIPFNRRTRGKLRRPPVVAWHGQNYKILCAMRDRSTTTSSHIAGSNLPTFNYFNALFGYTLTLVTKLSYFDIFLKYFIYDI